MSTDAGPTPEQSERLDELALLLTECRDVFMAAFDDGMLTPASGSQAERDFALELGGPAGAWPPDVNIQPRALAAKLVRQQADYCVAIGALVTAREVFDPMSSLVRGVFEYGTRARWIIDPSVNDPADPEVGHRIRSARTVLMELASTHHLREALHDREGLEEARTLLKTTWRRLRKLSKDMFNDVVIDGDPSKWSVEGHPYQSWTTIARTWASLESTPISGNRLYQLLAVEGHPQGFVATRGLRAGPDGPIRTFDIEDVMVRVQLAIVAFYSAMTLLANYHNYRSSIIVDWEARIEAVLPGAFQQVLPDEA